MIEGVVNGLKPTTRRAITAARPAHCKRALHASFWQHGALDNELPFWWSTFAQAGEVDIKRSRRTEKVQKDVCWTDAGLNSGFLDFLYPADTLRWLQRRSRAHNRKLPAGATQSRSLRRFSSVSTERRAAATYDLSEAYEQDAEDNYVDHDRDRHRARATEPYPGEMTFDTRKRDHSALPSPQGETFVDTKGHARPGPEELLRYMRGIVPAPNDGKTFEIAWDLFNEVDKDTVSDRDVLRLADFLSFSARGEERIRLTFLLRRYFDEASPRSRMLLQLQEGKLTDATATFKRDLGTINHVYDSGVSVLLAHAVRHNNWGAALQAGASFMKLRDSKSSTAPTIKERDPLLMYPRLSANYLQNVIDGARSMLAASKELSTEEKSFMQLLSCDAILSNRQTPDAALATELLDLLVRLEVTSRDFFQAVMSPILNALTQNKTHSQGYKARRRTLFEAYQRMQRAGLVLDQQHLSQLLSILAQPTDEPLEVEPHVLLDQYRSAYGDLDVHAANAMFKLHSRDKSVEQGRQLVANLNSKGEKASTNVWQILQLHYRRGQWDDVVNEFLGAPDSAKVKSDIGCWNTYLNALSRLGRDHDLAKAMTEMREHDVQPDQASYVALLGSHSYQGRTEKVLEILGIMKEEELALTSAALSHLVISYTHSDRMQAAEEAAQLITDTPDAYRSRDELTQPWNHVLQSYATRADVEACQRIFVKMKKLEVPADTQSYAALIEVLQRVKESDTAMRVMTEVMPANGIPVLQHHYALVMKGFLMERKYSKVLDIFNIMQKRSIEPEHDAWNMYLRALAYLDATTSQSHREKLLDGITQASEMERTMLTPLDMELNANVRRYKKPFEKTLADIIDIYAQAEQLDMVTELTSRAEILGIGNEDAGPNESLDLLQSLMTAALAGGKHLEVERFWDLCVAKVNGILQSQRALGAEAEKQTEAETPDWLEPDEVLSTKEVASHEEAGSDEPSQLSLEAEDSDHNLSARRERQRASILRQTKPMKKRLRLPDPVPPNHKQAQPFLLARPLMTLTESLVARGDLRTFKYLLTRLLEANFKLDNPAWNLVIQTLSTGTHAREILDAFRYCEEYLMPDFPGWRPAAITRKISFRPLVEKKEDVVQSNDYRYLNLPPTGRRPLGSRGEQPFLPYTDTLLALRKVFLKRLGGYELTHVVRPAVRGPDTPNIVLATYVEEEYEGKTRARLTTQALETIAPRTVEALKSMPEVNVRSTKRQERL